LPSAQKRKVLEKTRKRQRRGVVYLLLAVVLIVIIAVGVYAYFSSLPPSTIYATITTTKGVFEVELYQSLAPTTVGNFVSLAKSGFYNNLAWHRIDQTFVIQIGDPNTRNGGGDNYTWGQGHSPQTIPFENVTSLHNDPYTLAMARIGNDYNSASSQFFINLKDNRSPLDGQYAVFGKVISGMNVVDLFKSVPVYPAPTGGVCCQPKAPVPLLTSIVISNSP